MKAILFDLDGTLLPMEQELFTKAYFGALAKKMLPYGYDADKLIKGIWAGTSAMIGNDGTQNNETVFWNTFSRFFGDKVYGDKTIFDEFYMKDFDALKEVCGYDEEAGKTVKAIKELGYRLVLASNPIFPIMAQEKRAQWAGVSSAEFEFVTSYENSGYCKPNPEYYKQIINKIGCNADECLMVGNDVSEDMVAKEVGINVFLLTNCLINSESSDISIYPHGDFKQLINYIRQLN